MKKHIFMLVGIITALSILCMLATACDQDTESAATSYSIGGTITGISGSETTLSLNGTDTLTLNSNGSFVFEQKLTAGTGYTVTLSSQPSGLLNCTVTNGTGTIETDNIDNVLVHCSSSEFIWSITGDGAVLEGNSAGYTVQLSGNTLDPGEEASIKVNTNDGTMISATEGEDYLGIDNNILTITGPATSVSLQVLTNSDSESEPNEQFQVQISDPSIGVISPGRYYVETSIIDND